MRKLRAVLGVAAVVCLGEARAQTPMGDAGTPWKAQWITASRVPQRDEVVLHFRKVVELGSGAGHYWVNVSADNQFVLFVNGKTVGTGPAKSDLAHWRYETYDLGPYLKMGKNVLAATVWSFGTRSAVSQMSDRVGFLMHGASEAERAADSNESWEVEQEKGIAALPANVPGFYYAAGPGEKLDAGKFDWSFANETVKDQSAWTKAVTLGRGALRGERDAPNNWQLVKDPLPAMEMKEVANGKVVRLTGMDGSRAPIDPTNPAMSLLLSTLVVPARTKASILLDQGELTTGYPALTVSDGAGSNIRLTYSEALYDDKMQKGNRNEIKGRHIFGVSDEFLPSGEMSQEFMPVGWRTWRYLQIDVETTEHPLRFHGLRTWFSAYPFEEKGYFRSDDASLKQIWTIGWRTARLDAHDTYMDTPYWERLQYIGDTRIQALISYAAAGDDRLARQAIDAFNNSRIPEGLTQSRYPSELVQMIPTFSLLWVGMVHDFWMYRGDAEFVKAQLPGVQAVMDWYGTRQRADGLLGKIPWWPFVDWGKDFADGEAPQEADGGSSVITLQYVEALQYAAELEETYGDAHVADGYRAAAARATQGVWKLCWSNEYGLLADTPAKRHFSQHANILGIWLGVIPAEQQKELLGRILTRSESEFASTRAVPEMTVSTYYFRFYLARAVEHAGMGDWYFQLLQPWREMVKLGLTTWAESPEPTRSDSHAWSAHPNFDLLRIVAGIRPASVGFATVRIEPHLNGLPHLEAGIPTPRGMVEVNYTLTLGGDGLKAEVRLPDGVSGELVWAGKTVGLHGGEQQVQMGK